MSPAFVRAANSLRLFDHWITPFFRLSSHRPPARILKSFLSPFFTGPAAVTVQLMGTDPVLLAAAARSFGELGAAGINLNFCCPSRKVCSAGAGGGMLKTPERMTAILRQVKDAVPELPVSAKIRCGWQEPSELERIIPALLEGETLSLLLVHFRCVAEQYLPVAGYRSRWRRVIELAGTLPVVINGDLGTPAAIAAELAASGAAGAMAARGILRDPYLLRRAAGETAPEPEEGRNGFFAAVLREAEAEGGLYPGAAIELSNFIWGNENRYFDRLKTRKEAVTAAFLADEFN